MMDDGNSACCYDAKFVGGGCRYADRSITAITAVHPIIIEDMSHRLGTRIRSLWISDSRAMRDQRSVPCTVIHTVLYSYSTR